jgi:hypothetical protein
VAWLYHCSVAWLYHCSASAISHSARVRRRPRLLEEAVARRMPGLRRELLEYIG